MKRGEVQLLVSEAIMDGWKACDLRLGRRVFARFAKRDCTFDVRQVGMFTYEVRFLTFSGWEIGIPDIDEWRFQAEYV